MLLSRSQALRHKTRFAKRCNLPNPLNIIFTNFLTDFIEKFGWFFMFIYVLTIFNLFWYLNLLQYMCQPQLSFPEAYLFQKSILFVYFNRNLHIGIKPSFGPLVPFSLSLCHSCSRHGLLPLLTIWKSQS